MMTTNRDLMQQAREALKGRWGLAIGATVIYFILAGLISAIPRVGWIGSLIIDGPLILGITLFILSLSRGREAKLEQLFEGFQRFNQAMTTYLLLLLFIFLWTLLLVIPGIVAAFSYSMTFFLVADNPQLSGREALRRSKALMYGNRGKLFCLFWRFFGWFLLGIISLGIGFLWIIPYLQTTLARFYDDIKAEGSPPVVEGVVSPPTQP
ncbi:MAG: DUF975 family protein [Deltaproteobacteria bacterium]|nr:DUF975 family protein [Deltaproteobacteria bacterium]